MKTLFVNRMMGISWGGGENYDYHLARGLQALGHEAVMLTGKRKGSPTPVLDGLECIAIESPYLRHHMYNLAGKLPLVPGLFAETDLWLFMEKAMAVIRRIVKERGIDVVQILALPNLAARVARFSPVAMRFPGPSAWFQSGTLKRLARNPRSRMFTHGDAVRDFHNRLCIPVSEIPPGINREIFRRPTAGERASVRKELGIGEDEFVLSTIGRLIAGKGHEFLLRAVAQSTNPRLKVLIVGDGPLRARFEHMVAEAGAAGRVRFMGHTNSAGVARYLQASDTFCLLSEYENYSNAVLEAMAMGLPVIASSVGGFPDQVTEGENGHLIAHGDDEQFLMRLHGLIENPEQRARMAIRAEAFASRFSWESTARRVEEIYAELIA